VWLALLAALGLAAAAYKLLLYRFVSNHSEYRVVKATRTATALHLELEPVARAIAFRPGQFGFISLQEEGLREPHPFTIASGSDGHMHFMIRDLGDYTHRLLEQTRPGMYADIYAPYGRFERPAAGKREVWIAGGVGISPFIAWLTHADAARTSAATLFYFFTPGREFPSVERIKELAAKSATDVVPFAAGPSDPAFTQHLERIVREAGPSQVDVAFCGPKGLLEHVRAMLVRLGVPESNLRFEFFEFR